MSFGAGVQRVCSPPPGPIPLIHRLWRPSCPPRPLQAECFLFSQGQGQRLALAVQGGGRVLSPTHNSQTVLGRLNPPSSGSQDAFTQPQLGSADREVLPIVGQSRWGARIGGATVQSYGGLCWASRRWMRLSCASVLGRRCGGSPAQQVRFLGLAWQQRLEQGVLRLIAPPPPPPQRQLFCVATVDPAGGMQLGLQEGLPS